MINDYSIDDYKKAYEYALEQMNDFFNKNKNQDNFRNLFVTNYRENNLDPDSNAIRFKFGIKCTADGIFSIRRICNLEKNDKEIINVYKKYRKYPIFFFPKGTQKILGINRKRASVFGDRIDHTLYDIKMYYTENRDKCKLIDEFEKGNTKIWLEKMKSFENIVEWYGIKNIFTDSKYNVYDLETKNKIIENYKTKEEYAKQWSNTYYNNLKEKIDMFYGVKYEE